MSSVCLRAFMPGLSSPCRLALACADCGQHGYRKQHHWGIRTQGFATEMQGSRQACTALLADTTPLQVHAHACSAVCTSCLSCQAWHHLWLPDALNLKVLCVRLPCVTPCLFGQDLGQVHLCKDAGLRGLACTMMPARWSSKHLSCKDD